MYFKNRTGYKYGRLRVLSFVHFKKHRAYWKCRCSCGNIKVVCGNSLTSNNTRSCGCLLSENGRIQGQASRVHGHAKPGKKSKTYRIWQCMLNRCRNSSVPGFSNYGGRGIKVCKRWQRFKHFLLDMGCCPSKQHSLERINNDLGYSPKNVRWATRSVQSRNTRNNKYITYQRQTKCVCDWADYFKINRSTFCRKIKNGKTIEEIICAF